MLQNTGTQSIDEWITLIRLIEIDVAANIRNPKTVTIMGDAVHHSPKEAANLR